MPTSDLIKQFQSITDFEFTAQSSPPSKMSWNRSGSGTTTVKTSDNIVYFDDHIISDQKALDKKKWVFTENKLEFWRHQQGDYLHVFDFDLFAKTKEFISIAPHLCRDDTYSGTLSLTDHSLTFTIFIQSQVKNEEIRYVYG